MKEFAQIFLILGGGLGLLAAIPLSAYGWAMHRGFGGALTRGDHLLLYSPILCLVALGLGRRWRKAGLKKHRSSKSKLTEDGGAFGDVGGVE